EESLQLMLQCDVVVYNISDSLTKEQVEEATGAITAFEAEMDSFSSKKILILVSTVMTCAVTKPRDQVRLRDNSVTVDSNKRGLMERCVYIQEDPDALLTEEEYRRRRPLPIYVVASGLQYGKGEHLLHYFFKMSWLMQLPEVPLFGEGTNYLPMIHVNDLAGVLQNIINLKPRSKYILAVDDSKNTLEEVVKIISETLGTGKLRKVPEYEASTMAAFQAKEWASLSVDLRLESFIIKDSFSLKWTSEDGLINNIESIVEEYRSARQLLPVRIFLFGPPAVGKTTVAEKLCRHYKIHHIKTREVTEEKIAQLVSGITQSTQQQANFAPLVLKKRSTLLSCGGHLPDHDLFEILQEKLNSNPCKNQGFVLDGFPNTYDQAKSIFSDDDALDQDRMFKQPVCNKAIAPEHMIVLEATDDFLTQRVQGLPQSDAEKMLYTQEEFVSRLKTFRQLSASYDSAADYFDELEIHPDNIEERKQRLAEESAERERRKKATLAEMTAQYEQWQRNLAEVKCQEEELMEACALPLRSYLMKTVVPPLSEALLDCSKIKPEDPVDYL
ncbi:unnamed protein product, partial [Tetraodon nigroviridis]